jgi:hypothetical protein
MNSMQEALNEALTHPREYHPSRPAPLRRANPATEQNIVSPWVGVGVVIALAGIAFWAPRFFSRRAPELSTDEMTAGL